MVAETFTRLRYLPGSILPADVLVNFNEMLRRLYDETLVTLEDYEVLTYATGIPEEFVSTYPEDVAKGEKVAKKQGFAAGVTFLLTRWYPRLRRAFLSVGQGRMARGGKDFELQIEGLFKLASLSYEKQEKADHTDFMLPDAAFHTKNKTMAAVISVKRTLRERWAEVAEELFNLRTPNVFLFTADEDVTMGHVATICAKYNIHLVVWDAVKIKKFTATPMVLSYTEWASVRLPQLRQFWPKP
ncbi:MAG: type II restriction endonuclease [Dehalococcoidia bacterium]|nr:type II restriction endonuclease [Dehalococcoidia bacterium]